jgi:integrase
VPKPILHQRKRSAKPYGDFPLFQHATGQWAKKIRGRTHYFGTDPHAALAKYLEQRDDLQAGRVPRSGADGVTVRDLCNRFLTAKKNHLDAGELSPRTFSEYYGACELVVDAFGKARLLTDLTPEDFEKLRASFAGQAPVTAAKKVQMVRTLFKYALDVEMIDRPVRMGSAFRKPSRKVLRQAKQASGERLFKSVELRRILDAAGQPMRAMILLGINCGFGATDLAGLAVAAVDLDAGWIDYPRPKTAVPRRCPLWPQTVEALREVIAHRPAPRDEADAGLVFLTRCGQRWVRVTPSEAGQGGAVKVADAVCGEFIKLLRVLGLKRPKLGFYALRHTFRTVADAAKDQPAADFIMGHVSESMASVYRERIDDARLRAVVDVVRLWLWPKDRDRI